MKQVDVVAVIQARSSSTRLPGKVLMDIGGIPLLSVAIRRIKRSKRLTRIVIATSDGEDDNSIAELAKREGVDVFRGNLEDVASRFVKIATESDAPLLVRLCGDSPFLDASIVDEAISVMNNQECDLVTTVNPRTVPHGLSVEVLVSEAFLVASKRFSSTTDKEHVTRYFYEHPSDFRIKSYSPIGVPETSPSLAVDTGEDLVRIRKIASKLGDNLLSASWKEILMAAKEVENETS